MKTCWLKETRRRLSPGRNVNETLKKRSVSRADKVQTSHYPFQLIGGLSSGEGIQQSSFQVVGWAPVVGVTEKTSQEAEC